MCSHFIIVHRSSQLACDVHSSFPCPWRIQLFYDIHGMSFPLEHTILVDIDHSLFICVWSLQLAYVVHREFIRVVAIHISLICVS